MQQNPGSEPPGLQILGVDRMSKGKKMDKPMDVVKLDELVGKSAESLTDPEIKEMVAFLRESSAKYEVELKQRAEKKKGRDAKSKTLNLSDILSDTLD